jgi:DNA-binding transcriptional MerR regulator
VLLIRRIRELLYEEGFTISGARNRLDNAATGEERQESGARAARAPAAAQGAVADVSALKRELRELLDSLRAHH